MLRLSRGQIAVPCLVLAGLVLGSTPGASEVDASFGSSFRLIYERHSDFWHRELEVFIDDRANGTAKLTFTGDRRGDPWDEPAIDAECTLDRRLVGELRTLLRKSNVFEGQFWGKDGRGQHFPFDTLEVRDGRVAILVSSFNESFDRGARKQLVELLDDIDLRLSDKNLPADCNLKWKGRAGSS